jgi:pyruvate dehydrogenase E2 component (dihydrolipoamide acetyltransferase)
LTPFILMATASALKQNTKFTVSLSSDDEKIIYKKFINIGVTVNTAGGLIVPVLREVDQKSIFDLAEELTQLTLKSRNQSLTQDDLNGGCFTILNLGKYGRSISSLFGTVNASSHEQCSPYVLAITTN